MDQTSELEKAKNRFEIEERIFAVLSDSEDIEKFNNLRSKDIISTEDRLKSTTKRETYWNQLVNQFIAKHFPHLMNNQQQPTTNNSDLIRIAELLAEVAAISAANKKDFDFIEKPSRYDGSRDAHIIDAWIQAIDDYSNLKDYTDIKKCQLAVALLSGSARVWYSNLRIQERAPTDWLSFRRELLSFFKPENYVSLARDKIRTLRQTTTISNYVKDFLSIKLSIPTMTDDEAVDKFLAGLKDYQARIHIKDVVNMEFPVLSDVIKAAYIYEGNREEGISSKQNNRSSNHNEVDDPMDLSVAEKREFLNAVRSFRGGYRGSSRGGFRGNSRGSYHRNNSRGGFIQSRGNTSGSGNTRDQSSYSNRSNSIKCYNCKGFGHIAKDCSSPRINDVNYIEDTSDDSYENNNLSNKASDDFSNYLYCVLPSSQCFVEPLIIDSDIIEKDMAFLLSADKIQTKLPLYDAYINGKTCAVLIDSGASANYISPDLLSVVSKMDNIQGQTVETANGHQSNISAIATFSIKLGNYVDDMQAYVFDTKFDLILGNAWLRQVQPIPDWFNSSWEIKLSDGTTTVIHPRKVDPQIMRQKLVEVKDTDEETMEEMDLGNIITEEVEDCDFIISARQFDRLLRKNQVEECFLVSAKEIYNILDVNNIDISDTDTKIALTEQERKNQEWCDEFAKAYPSVFKGTLDTLPPIRRTDGDMIELEPDAKPISRAPYRMSPLELKELRRQLDDLLSKGFIEPCVSERGSPVLFVKKPNGSLRMVCDYRALNAKTIAQRVPLPRIDACLEQFHEFHWLN
jgi:hypothetical protein